MSALTASLAAPKTDARRAVRISTAVAARLRQTRFAGQAHSVFRRAINVDVGGALIAIATPSAGLSPNGLVLEDDRDLPLHLIRPGDLVQGDGRHLFFPDAHLTVTLSEAIPWSPRLVPIRAASVGNTRRNVELALRVADNRVPQRGFGPLLRAGVWSGNSTLSSTTTTGCARAWPSIQRVRGALVERDVAGAIVAATSLIGLGVGLTPSGDDFILGLAAALVVRGHPLGADFAAGCARAARGRTTDIAATFLEYAGRGEYAERVHRLLGALIAGSQADVRHETENVLTWGETSGGDCLLGILVGLDVDPSAAVLSSRERQGRVQVE